MKDRTIVVFAPHPDDELLGCGGVIAKRKKQGYKVVICIATNGKNEVRFEEEKKSCEYLQIDHIEFLNFPDLHLDSVPKEKLTKKLLEVIDKYKPEEVYMPHRFDLHTDHRVLSEALLVAIRPKYKNTPTYAYTYETMSETGWNFQESSNSFNPNVYEDITEEIEQKKTALKMHESQVYQYPSSRSVEAVEALAVYRGVQAEMKYAEAFCLVRCYKR